MGLGYALKAAFSWNRRALYAGLLLYGATFLFGSVALSPLRAALHALLDTAPAAAGLSGGDLSLLSELFMLEKGLGPAAFGALPLLLLLFLPVVLFLQGAVYAQAARETQEEKFWHPFLEGGSRVFLPFLGLVLLNLVFYLLVAIPPALALAGIHRGLKEATDPRTGVFLLVLYGAVGGLLFVMARNGAGFARAHRALRPAGEPLGRAFLRSTAFTFRRFLPVTALGLFFVAARWLWLFFFALVLNPGTATAGRAAAAALLLQAGYLGTALLRVAEARAQVAYLRPFLDGEAPPAAAPSPPPPPAEPQGFAPGAEGPFSSPPSPEG
ncbi:MAG: hypothetical protein ACP5VN_11360 [Acidobacteriota bacterium]